TIPVALVQRSDLVREATSVQSLECDRRFEGDQDLANLFVICLMAGLEGEPSTFDGHESAASQVVVKITRAVKHGQQRPDDSGRLGGTLARDTRDQLPAIQHPQPLD